MVSKSANPPMMIEPRLKLIMELVYSMFLRVAVSMGSYSGKGKPPMYGDYEAQRHWQEITINLGVKEWYKNSTENDLQYWGLDYPPLTAYHSWICGFVARMINPQWVALNSSRGFESHNHQFFMRCTVFFADVIFYYFAVLLYTCTKKTSSSNPKYLSSYAIFFLLYPGIILIDYGHFQYNNVSIGLFLLSLYMLEQNHDIFGSVFFCASLNYKQMELYHALPIFCYLSGKALNLRIANGVRLLLCLAMTVVLSFAVFWYPFLDFDSASNVLSRIFPVGRGLYEDKVANFWCAVSPVIKFKNIFSVSTLFKLCGLVTLAASAPSCIHLLLNSKVRNLKLALLNVSLAFFLFSFHVHEKSILIPATTACLLYCKQLSLPINLFLYYTVVSMSPLLLKDGLILQTISLSYIYLFICHAEFSSLQKQASFFLTCVLGTCSPKDSARNRLENFVAFVTKLMYFLGFVLMILPLVLSAPTNLPDLFALLNAAVSFLIFMTFYLVCNYVQVFTSVNDFV